jgi:hypothetical protein
LVAALAGMAATFAIPALVIAQGGFAPPELAISPVAEYIYVIRSGFSGSVVYGSAARWCHYRDEVIWR